jgi:RNA polymerase-binding transcription factor DksA|tara:strand:- start:2588 stop:2998 length:411 start_codon:yes stop_codon:yes gene_type:complete
VAKKAYTKSELKKFEKNILEKIGEINESIEGVRSTTQPNNSVFIEERSEDFNEGTEAHEVEKNFLLMSRESDYIVNLNKALQRIKDGNYGICEVYQKDAEKCECPDSPLIAKERLMEVPNATKGVFCKEKKKLNLL